MTISRRTTAAFVGVFLVGNLVGALTMMDFSDQRFSKFLNRTSDPANLAQRLDQKLVSDYQLSNEENARIKPLTTEMAQRIFEQRRQFGTNIVAILDEYHAKIAAQMTPEQREDYQKRNADRRQRALEMLIPDAKSPPSEAEN